MGHRQRRDPPGCRLQDEVWNEESQLHSLSTRLQSTVCSPRPLRGGWDSQLLLERLSQRPLEGRRLQGSSSRGFPSSPAGSERGIPAAMEEGRPAIPSLLSPPLYPLPAPGLRIARSGSRIPVCKALSCPLLNGSLCHSCESRELEVLAHFTAEKPRPREDGQLAPNH